MGTCYSNKKVEEGKMTTPMDRRPFFRSANVGDTTYTNHHQAINVWLKRKVHDVTSQEGQEISIETVLHNDWWKDDIVDKDPKLPDIPKPPENRRQLPPLPVSKAYDDDTADDTYNTINEDEMDDTNDFIICDKDHKLLVMSKSAEKYLSPLSSASRVSKTFDAKVAMDRYNTSDVYEHYTEQDTYDDDSATDPVNKSLKSSKLSTAFSTTGNSVNITEEQEQCLEYSEMVNIFKPLIVQNVLIHDILPHLSFLDDPACIYEEVKSSERGAVLSLLDKLDESKALGKWQKFIDALNACGYTYIVDNIRGYKFINHHYQREYLKTLTPKLMKMISPPELMTHLMAKDLLSDTDKENIMKDCNNFGNIRGAITLLDRITRKHRNWYMLFIEALEDAQFCDVAADLRIEKLMDNGRVKETHDICLVDEIKAGINTDQVIEPPPIPPRVPIIRKRYLTPTHDDLPYDNGKSRHTRYDGQNTCNETPTETCANSLDDEIYEPYESYEPIRTDSCTSNDNAWKPNDIIPQFNDIKNDISLLKQEELTLYTEVSLLEKKSLHGEKVLDHLKKRNQLKYSIALMEKERNALRHAPSTCEEGYEDQHAADVYYPGSDRSRNLLTWRTRELDFVSTLAVEYQPVALTSDCTLSPLPLFSPTFDKIAIRRLRSDKDSGTGTIDAESEE